MQFLSGAIIFTTYRTYFDMNAKLIDYMSKLIVS